jgi:hypothetical protein
MMLRRVSRSLAAALFAFNWPARQAAKLARKNELACGGCKNFQAAASAEGENQLKYRLRH